VGYSRDVYERAIDSDADDFLRACTPVAVDGHIAVRGRQNQPERGMTRTISSLVAQEAI
jgi:hypothetical protein